MSPDGGEGGGGTPDGSGSSGTGAGEGSNGGSNGSGTITFDDFLKQEGNQAEFDRRVTKAITTAVTKETNRLLAIHNEELAEQDRISKMTDAEKTAYLQKKQEKAISDREAAITKRELAATAKDTLATKGLPIELSEILVYTDETACNQSLESVERVFNDAVSKAVENKLKGDKPPTDPKTGGNSTNEEKMAEEVRAAIGVRI